MTPSASIAYLVSPYPATNHTFVLREIVGLRALGLDVRAVSIRPPDRPFTAMTATERTEAQSVFCVRNAGLGGLFSAHIQTLVRHPFRYLRTLLHAARLGAPSPRRMLYHSAYFAQAIIIGNWLSHNNIKHIHSHFSSTVALLLSGVFPITWSATMHGPDEFSNPKRFHLKEKCRSAALLVAISDYGLNRLRQSSTPADWPKFHTCRLGVDPAAFAPAPFRESPEPFQVLSVGRLAPVKAQHILLEALELLVRQGRSVRLRIVGQGPSREFLEAEILRRRLGTHATLEGALNQDRLLPLYASADLFALSSLAEGIPVVLMEAMAREIACVATAVNGVPELIEDGSTGLLVPPSDPNALAQAVARLMDDSPLRRALARAGRERVCQSYDLAANIRQLCEIFKSAGIACGDTSTAESANR